MDTVRESALKVSSGEKSLAAIGELNLPQWQAGLSLYQLSYIPAHICGIANTFQ